MKNKKIWSLLLFIIGIGVIFYTHLNILLSGLMKMNPMTHAVVNLIAGAILIVAKIIR